MAGNVLVEAGFCGGCLLSASELSIQLPYYRDRALVAGKDAAAPDRSDFDYVVGG